MLATYLIESTAKPGQWVCSLDLDWLETGEQLGYIEVFGKSRQEAACAMVSFLWTIQAAGEFWLLDEEERAYLTAYMRGEGRPKLRIHMKDWNHGRGKTAWCRGGE